jgi:hypothetical protein
MKKIELKVKQPIFKVEALSYVWKRGKRILVRTTEGIFIGTVSKNSADFIYINLDNGNKLQFKQLNKSILGEGINRKRKSAIPDDELYQWKKELRSDAMRKINGKQ